MKPLLFTIFLLLSLFLSGQKINWVTSVEEAEALLDKSKKKELFIDFYTDWCGYCKLMDKKTFTDPEVIAYMNKNYIALKFNAESPDAVVFNGLRYKFVPYGRKGFNAFSYFMSDKRLSYPTFSVIGKNKKLKKVLSGYLSPKQILQQLKKHN